MTKEKMKLALWVKIILIIIADIVIAKFIIPIFSGVFSGVSDASYPWIITLLDTIGLALALGLVKQFVKFEPKDANLIGRVLVMLNIIITLISVYVVMNVFQDGYTTGINLGMDILRLLVGSVIIYYTCIFVLPESKSKR